MGLPPQHPPPPLAAFPGRWWALVAGQPPALAAPLNLALLPALYRPVRRQLEGCVSGPRRRQPRTALTHWTARP
jgi:hypothetical protein